MSQVYRRLDQQQEENRRSFEAINTRMDRMDDQLSFLCYSNQMANEQMLSPYQNTAKQFKEMEMQGIPVTIANLAIHRQREEEINQERMRLNYLIVRGEELCSPNNEGNRRDKPTIEFDPEIEKTLKKNRSRAKAQRALQFEQEEINSEEGASEKSFEEELVEENTEEEIQDNMADNANNQRRTLADYTNPTTTSCGSSIVWPTVDANNFKLKPALVQLV
ncbi:hypothetical protein PIB30_097943 [Stylosanthes scabra]|uniref:Uncharacterized protein n=1 Tax=Stylosanthes scabra TaxID=79078 RepID=A0ABU6XXG7_9FABA|nr:hypothetical protein [Stylosanthes scabra]